MKRRYRYSLNLFSFGLLLFALYLNFIKKEPVESSAPSNTNSTFPAQHLKQENKTVSLTNRNSVLQ